MSAATKASKPAPKKRKSGLRRIIVLLILIVLLLPVAGYFALPPIAGAMIPGVLERAAANKIDGSLNVDSASFSWSGTQRITGIELADPEGNPVATVDLSMKAGLLDLVLGSRDLGTITISGNADITRNADGSTNLQRALGKLLDPDKPKDPDAKPASLPRNLKARLELAGFNASYTDLQTGRVARLSNITIDALLAPDTPFSLDATADLRASEAADPNATGEPARLAANINLTDWSDAEGRLTPEKSAADLSLSIDRVRTAILDDALQQRGLLVDLLGDTSTTTLKAALSRESAVLDFRFESPRAAVTLDGTVTDRVLRLNQPAVLELRTISPALADRAFQAVPWVGSIEKTAADGPATITLSSLTLPLTGALEGFDADLTVDLGAASFQASPEFARVLSLANWDVSGQVGRRLEPLNLTVRSGTLSYDEFAVPVGEFSLLTKGKIDLVNRTREVVVTVPFDALSEEFASKLKLDLTGQLARLGPVGDVLKDATRVPLKVTGNLDSPPTIEVDTEQMKANLMNNLTRPGGTGEQLLRGILDRIGG